MSLFDEIGRKIVETGQSAAQKTRGMTETMKLNSMISEEEKSIKKAFYQIGKKYCEIFGRNPDQNFAQLISGIRDSMEKIQAYSEQIKQVKGIVNCPSCGYEVSYESPFCGDCGTPMYSVQASEGSAGGAFCGDCGARIESSATLCMECGSKIEQADAPELYSAKAHVTEPRFAVKTPQGRTFSDFVSNVCSKCESELTENAMFCMTCGHTVKSA